MLPGEQLSSSAHEDDFQHGCIVSLKCLNKVIKNNYITFLTHA